MMNGDSTSVKN